MAAAAPELPFRPVLPRELGTPAAVFIQGVDDRERQALALVFAGSRFGRFWVFEAATDPNIPPQAAIEGSERLVAECRDPAAGCEGEWSIVTLVDGSRGLMVAGPESTTIGWATAGIRFQVMGPAHSFSASDARTVAEMLAAAAT